MIPPRRLSGENCGNGVSYRVAVCRKRLRISRTTPRGQSNPHLDACSLTSPGAANELIARQILSPRTELAATVPSKRVLIGVSVEVGVEAGAIEIRSAAPEKAEDT